MKIGVKVFVKPWLQKTHKNFFLIYVVTMIFHIWSGMIGLMGQGFVVPGLHYINIINPGIWAIANIIIAVMMIAGLHRKSFTLSRLALSAGMFWCLLRFLLISAAWVSGYAVGLGPVLYFLAAGLHRSQTLA